MAATPMTVVKNQTMRQSYGRSLYWAGTACSGGILSGEKSTMVKYPPCASIYCKTHQQTSAIVKDDSYFQTQDFPNLIEVLPSSSHLLGSPLPKWHTFCRYKSICNSFLEWTHGAETNADMSSGNMLDELWRANNPTYSPSSQEERFASRTDSQCQPGNLGSE